MRPGQFVYYVTHRIADSVWSALCDSFYCDVPVKGLHRIKDRPYVLIVATHH